MEMLSRVLTWSFYSEKRQIIIPETKTTVSFLLASKNKPNKLKQVFLQWKRKELMSLKVVLIYVYLFIPNLCHICVYICICNYAYN